MKRECMWGLHSILHKATRDYNKNRQRYKCSLNDNSALRSSVEKCSLFCKHERRSHCCLCCVSVWVCVRFVLCDRRVNALQREVQGWANQSLTQFVHFHGVNKYVVYVCAHTDRPDREHWYTFIYIYACVYMYICIFSKIILAAAQTTTARPRKRTKIKFSSVIGVPL